MQQFLTLPVLFNFI